MVLHTLWFDLVEYLLYLPRYLKNSKKGLVAKVLVYIAACFVL